jgi:hypothetical protein
VKGDEGYECFVENPPEEPRHHEHEHDTEMEEVERLVRKVRFADEDQAKERCRLEGCCEVDDGWTAPTESEEHEEEVMDVKRRSPE